MSKNFVYLHNKAKHIIEFEIGYMVDPTLYVNEDFKEWVEKCTNDTFGTITQLFI